MKIRCSLVVLSIVALTLTGCASAPAQQYSRPVDYPAQSREVYTQPINYPAPTGLSCKTYNNTRPGGKQLLDRVDSAEIRPNLLNPGAQLWFHEDGRWDSQGGKFSLLFPSQEAFQAYCANPNPSPAELRRLAEAEPLCPSSVGKGQKWLMFKVGR